MGEIKLNPQEIQKWFRDRGDETHNLNYELNEDSVVIDLGGYTGVWGQQIINKYNPNLYIIEPVPSFFNGMVTKFSGNNKVRLLNVGVSSENKYGSIFISNDGTSSNLNSGEEIKVKFNTIDEVLNMWDLKEVDLIQINIEGDEYPLLESMLETGSVNKFKNIQVQFHLGIKDDINRRNKIRKELLNNGFKLKFDYAFVWESWERNE
jgi:FkbM family methyltransferase